MIAVRVQMRSKWKKGENNKGKINKLASIGGLRTTKIN